MLAATSDSATCCYAGKLGDEEAQEGGGSSPPIPSFKNIKAVLFDIDGTMTDSDPIHFIAYALADQLAIARCQPGAVQSCQDAGQASNILHILARSALRAGG